MRALISGIVSPLPSCSLPAPLRSLIAFVYSNVVFGFVFIIAPGEDTIIDSITWIQKKKKSLWPQTENKPYNSIIDINRGGEGEKGGGENDSNWPERGRVRGREHRFPGTLLLHDTDCHLYMISVIVDVRCRVGARIGGLGRVGGDSAQLERMPRLLCSSPHFKAFVSMFSRRQRDRERQILSV